MGAAGGGGGVVVVVVVDVVVDVARARAVGCVAVPRACGEPPGSAHDAVHSATAATATRLRRAANTLPITGTTVTRTIGRDCSPREECR